MSARRATIADVAREAGVSPSTASVVFSGKTQVTDATRQRVLAAASALGYTGPDPRAASLRRGRSGIIGVVLGGRLRSAFLDPVTTVVLDGISEGIAPLDAAILLLRDDATETGPSLMTAPIDGAVLLGCSAHMRSSLDDVRGRGIPVVDRVRGIVGVRDEEVGDEAADATMGVVMMMRMVMTVTVRVVMVMRVVVVVRVVVVARVVVGVAAVMPLRILGAATVCGSPRRGHELTLSAWW